MSKILKKQIKSKYGTTFYLLGKDSQGLEHYLAAPKWDDKKQYWNFGFLYQYNKGLMHPLESFNYYFDWHKDSQCFHINDTKSLLTITTLSNYESWELSELIKMFYVLINALNLFEFGCVGLSYTSVDVKNKEMSDKINKEVLPKVFEKINIILSPNSEV